MNRNLLFISGVVAIATSTQAGVFFAAGQNDSNVDRITHAQNSQGGGVATTTFCIDPNATWANDAVGPTINVVATINRFQSVPENIVGGSANNIPSNSQFDFESVLLHEAGHCIGLGHPNMGNQSGVANNETNYTHTVTGGDGVFNFGSGVDGVPGSSDDQRGNDTSLFWFRPGTNNPFVIPTGTIDEGTMTQALSGLPNGDSFPANPDRAVGVSEFGISNSESVMQQGTFNDEAQRDFHPDDITMLRLGMAGNDGVAGTGDDYTIRAEYGGIRTGGPCNVVIESSSGFASCSASFTFSGNHARLTSGTIRLSNSTNWFFNDEPNDLIFESSFGD